jgi:predicted ATPase
LTNREASYALSHPYCLSLTVENFRCFKPSQVIDFSIHKERIAQWTVILGENGTGKTTLLRLLSIMQPTQSGAKGNIIHNIKDKPLQSQLKVIVSEWLYDNGTQKTTGLNLEIGIGRLSSYIISKHNESVSLTRNENNILWDADESFVKGILCVGYGASRHPSSKPISDSENRRLDLTLFDQVTELTNAEEWLILSDYSVRIGDTQAKERYEKIKEVLVRLLPHVEDFRFTMSLDGGMTPRVEALTPYGWVRVRDLSLGYQTALAWVVDFASRLFERYPDSENPLAEPAICLVDEIDLHLHPKWQRELLRLLSDTFPQTQFIVTAHSPLIVQAAPNANLALLRRNGDHVEIINDIDYIRKWRIDQILASELFGEQPIHAPEIEDLLNERTNILSKPRLTAKDRARVTVIDAELDKLPSAARPDDQEAMDLIRDAARILHGKKG